jgi:hypothetical protein
VATSRRYRRDRDDGGRRTSEMQKQEWAVSLVEGLKYFRGKILSVTMGMRLFSIEHFIELYS